MLKVDNVMIDSHFSVCIISLVFITLPYYCYKEINKSYFFSMFSSHLSSRTFFIFERTKSKTNFYQKINDSLNKLGLCRLHRTLKIYHIPSTIAHALQKHSYFFAQMC